MAQGLTTALVAALSPAALAAAFLAWAKRTYPGSKPNATEAAAWLETAERVNPRIAPAVGRAFADAYAEGWLAGRDSAAHILMHDETTGGSIRDSAGFGRGVGWSWDVGDPNDARRVLAGLGDGDPERFWRDNAQLMRTAVRGRIADIARILAEGYRAGDSPQAIARELRTVLDDPKWAYKVAVTEVNRAVSAATLHEYELSGVPAKEWMTAFDQRVCKICEFNEQIGPLPLAQEFPSGELHPPGHPHCRCGLIPAYRDRQ